MSENIALPLRLADTSTGTPNGAAGTQTSYHQIGGSGNTQYNANTINQHYASPTRAETPPLPTSTVAFPRDPNFIDRPELKELEKRLSPRRRGARVALVGLGGIGKTQLAIEYCYRLRERSPDTWVLWVHARSPARLEESLRKLANDVKIPGRDGPQADIFQLVRGWLFDAKRKWLLVVDNADDPEVLFQPYLGRNGVDAVMKVLMDCVPVCENGTTIITTRNQAVAKRLVEVHDTIEVRRMSEPDAVRLVVTRIQNIPGGRRDTTGTEKLVKALDGVPLALAQAAAYITRTWPRCSIQQYLTQLEADESSQLLHTDYQDLRREQDAENAIFKTWQISFEEINRSDPSAARLLSLMCFYDHQSIPTLLLRNASYECFEAGPEESSNRPDTSKGTTFNEDIRVLLDYHFISIAPEEDNFEMHRLVQQSARNWIKSHGQSSQWAERSIENLDAVFPRVSFKNWEQCRILLPHARLFVDSKPDGRRAILAWASVLHQMGRYLFERGIWNEAELLIEMSIAAKSDTLGDDDPLTLVSRSLLGSMLTYQGKDQAAEGILRLVSEKLEEVLGQEHEDTLRSMNYLAYALYKQYKLEEAETIYREVLEIREKVLSKEHHDMLDTLNNLALCLEKQGRFKEVEKIHQEVLEIREKVLGREHPNTLSSLNNLASCLYTQGKSKEAEKMNREVLEIREKVLGKEHPNTLASLNNLASCLNTQGKYKEAEKMHREVLEIREKVLGKESPNTLTSLNNLASCLKKQGKHKEAEVVYREVLESKEKVLGKEHPNTLMALYNLAQCLVDLRRYEEALTLMASCAETRRRVLGPEHPKTILACRWVDAIASRK